MVAKQRSIRIDRIEIRVLVDLPHERKKHVRSKKRMASMP